MNRYWKWIAVAGAVIVVLAIAALAAVPLLVDTPRIQALIATNATAALGRPVKFESVSVRVLPLPAIELHGLEVAEDPQFGAVPFLKLQTGRFRLKLLPLLTGRVELGDIILTKPLITVIQSPDGRLNVASLGGPADGKGSPRQPRSSGGGTSGAGAALASRVSIEDAIVTYVSRGKGDALTRYFVEDLDVTLSGGSQVAFKGSGRVKPGDLTFKITDGLVAMAGARTLLEAPVRAKVALDGKDITPLVAVAAGPSPALGGAVKGELAVGGTVGSPTAAGDFEMSKVTVTQVNPQCPKPKRRTLTLPTVKVNAAWQDNRFVGKPVTTAIGDGSITTQMQVTLDRGVRVQMNDLGIKALPLEKVLVDFLCQGYAITGPLDLTGALEFSPVNIWTTLSGPGQLRVGRGKVVGSQALALIGNVVRVGGALSALLNADLPTNLFNSPLEFDSIAGTYRVKNGVATTRDLLYTSRAMRVAIAGDYGLANGRMNLDMMVTTSRGEIKAKVTGTAASPSIRIVPSTLIDPGKVEKGLGDLLRQIR